MSFVRIQVTLKSMFVIIAIIAAYLAGIFSNRLILNEVKKELVIVQKDLEGERTKRQVAEAMARLSILNEIDNAPLDKIEQHVRLLDAFHRDKSRRPSIGQKWVGSRFDMQQRPK